jgi:serine/threonine protein kinase
VWECVHRVSGVRYCVKVIDRRRLGTPADEESALREMVMLSSLATYKSQRLVELIQVMEDAKQFHIITKLASKGNLLTRLISQCQNSQKPTLSVVAEQPHHHLLEEDYTSSFRLKTTTTTTDNNDNKTRPLSNVTWSFTERNVQELARSLLEGVTLLHSLGICHYNLQPENILLQEDNQVSICDFGCAVYLRGDSSCGRGRRRRYGSLPYAAPEVIRGDKSSKGGTVSDMWSVGVILYYCLCGWLPFEDVSRSQLKEKIIKGAYAFAPLNNATISRSPHSNIPLAAKKNVWDSISRPAKQLVSNLLHVNPEVRLTAVEALEHSWLAIPSSNSSSSSSSSLSSGLGSSPVSHSPKNKVSKSSRHCRRGSLLVQRLCTKLGVTSSTAAAGTFTSHHPTLELEGDWSTSCTNSSSL